MPTTFANTIDSNPIYAKRAEEDQNGLNIDQTYAKKSELPTVNDGTLTIQKNGTTVDTFTANSSSNKTVNIEVPTKTSDLTNDSGFITASDIPAQVQSNWNETDTSDPSYIQNKPSIPAAQVNSDWNASSGVAEILNKPSIPTATSDLTNDSGFITASDVPASQEQADWNESNSSDPAYIKNKPSIPAAQVNSDWNASSGVAEILNKPSIPSATSDLTNDSGFITASDVPGAQEQADWNESNSSDPAYIKNKPSIPAAQVNSDWNASSGVAEILNKPSIPTATSDLTNDSGFITASDVPGAQEQADWQEADSNDPAYIKNKPTIPPAQVNSDWNASSGVAEILNKPSIPSKTSDLQNDSGFITSSDIPAQVQSDWTESDTTDPAYIQNKPSIPSKTSDLQNDSGFITSSDIPAQVQSDWNENDNTDPAYIKNKPSIPAAQVNSDWNASSGVAEILNKPSIPSATSDLQNDSGFITASDVPGAQEQADWNESDSNDPAYIKNKPSIPAAQVNSDWNASSGVAKILNKPSIPSATSDLQNDSGFITASDVPAAQEQADWNESDSNDPAYIKNKPSIPAAQVNSDWNASSGVAEILNKPTIRNVPDVTSSDGDKVLKASYSGGVGSYSWETESGGENVEIIDIDNISTRFSSFNELFQEARSGKVLFIKDTLSLITQCKYYVYSWGTNGGMTPTDACAVFTAISSQNNRYSFLSDTIWINYDLTYTKYSFDCESFRPLLWIASTIPNLVPAGTYYKNQILFVNEISPTSELLILYRCKLTYTANGTQTPYTDSTHWERLYLKDYINELNTVEIDVTPSNGALDLIKAYRNNVLISSGDITSITNSGDIDTVVIQWTVASSTALPTMPNGYHAASANPTSLTVGKTYQLSLLNNCYSIVEFG